MPIYSVKRLRSPLILAPWLLSARGRFNPKNEAYALRWVELITRFRVYFTRDSFQPFLMHTMVLPREGDGGAMSKKEKNKNKSAKTSKPVTRPIAENRKARHRFDILETLECGVALVGSEVKSLRNGKLSLDESYGRLRSGELWLVGADIPEYSQATIWNHEPKRPRKLLIHRRELRKFANQAREKGLTLVPLKVYFNSRGIAKVLMGLGRGRKLHDKREAIKKADVKRDIARAMRHR